jgi:hypothetical protein
MRKGLAEDFRQAELLLTKIMKKHIVVAHGENSRKE